ncbi:GNAT family N-acetyltransferase [Fusibacter bizertensis]|jgi:Acetyltransferases, including N-acetylases of ribosomal proteins|uniref:GNAT family N-acetyltransferase n=1 Tax=Fusibacter bizertensis TaxID=1488331 RepID=A0ABT6NDN2_9FIRM|nr:GNAT family N-acetyltransferase [Fusibacter bizertensis]MDH8678475.1 GNAT family N-acetyltransferase [Fusibacter bizertensis]
MKSVIKTPRLTLSVLDAKWSEKICQYYIDNRDFLESWEPYRHNSFYTIDTQKIALELDYQGMIRGEMIRFWIIEDETEEIIGSVALTNIIKGVFKSCYLGYKLSKKHINLGYMTESIQAVINYAFDEMYLHRIEANIMPRNFASIRVVEKLGFEFEGCSKQYLKINGIWEDHNRYALLNTSLSD